MGVTDEAVSLCVCVCTRAYTTCIYTVLGCGITVGVNQLTKQTPCREAMCVFIWEKNAPPSVTTHTNTHMCTITPGPPPFHSLTSLLCPRESCVCWHLNQCKYNMFSGSVMKSVCLPVHNPHFHPPASPPIQMVLISVCFCSIRRVKQK